MRNLDGLTPKEFLFCEEYLSHGNMEKAYKVAFPNDKGRNAWRTAKRKEVVCYINKRLHEKQATMSRLRDKALTKVFELLDSDDEEIVAEATKIVAKYEELATKYEELQLRQREIETTKEVSSTGTINITFAPATKESEV